MTVLSKTMVTVVAVPLNTLEKSAVFCALLLKAAILFSVCSAGAEKLAPNVTVVLMPSVVLVATLPTKAHAPPAAVLV